MQKMSDYIPQFFGATSSSLIQPGVRLMDILNAIGAKEFDCCQVDSRNRWVDDAVKDCADRLGLPGLEFVALAPQVSILSREECFTAVSSVRSILSEAKAGRFELFEKYDQPAIRHAMGGTEGVNELFEKSRPTRDMNGWDFEWNSNHLRLLFCLLYTMESELATAIESGQKFFWLNLDATFGFDDDVTA